MYRTSASIRKFEMNGQIDGFVVGDTIGLRRWVDLSDIEPDMVVSGKLTVKANEGDADPGVFQLEVTVTSGGEGLPFRAQVDIAVGSADTVLLSPDVGYYYDIQLITGNGLILTVEKGLMTARAQVTTATS